MNAAEITDKLGLHALRQRNWYIQATCATSGDGLYEGLDWLSNQLKSQKWSIPTLLGLFLFCFVCCLFFFCFDTAAAPDPGPPTDPSHFWSHLTQCSAPALSLQNFLQPPFYSPSLPAFSLHHYPWGSSLCCLYVVCACVCVYRACMGVKASLVYAGWDWEWPWRAFYTPPVELAVWFLSPSPPPSPSAKLSRRPAKPPTPLPSSLARPSTFTLQRKHGFHTAKKEQGCPSLPVVNIIYMLTRMVPLM